LKVWSVADGTIQCEFDDAKNDVLAAAFHPKAAIVVAGGAEPGYRVYDLTAKKLLAVRPTQTTITALAFLADGSQLVSGSAGAALVAWDTSSWVEQARFVGSKAAVTGLFVPQRGSEKLITSTDTAAARSFSITQASITGTKMPGHESWVTCMAMTPDGRKLVTGSWDGTVRVWDPLTAKEVENLESHKSKIYALALDAAGKRAASAGGEGEVYVWSLESNDEIGHLEGHKDNVHGIAFWPMANASSPRGRTKPSASGTSPHRRNSSSSRFPTRRRRSP